MTTASGEVPAPPRRPRFRFTVRALLVLVLAIAAAFGWLARGARLQRQPAAAVARAGGHVVYDYPATGTWHGIRVPGWLGRAIGPDYLGHIRSVVLQFRGSDAELAHLGSLSRLNYLDLYRAPVTDRGLANLRGLDELHWLSVSGTGVGDAGLAHLAGLVHLPELHLDGSRITDAGLAHLATMEGLVRLSLGHTAVADAGLRHLAGLRRLRYLSLGHRRDRCGPGRIAAGVPGSGHLHGTGAPRLALPTGPACFPRPQSGGPIPRGLTGPAARTTIRLIRSAESGSIPHPGETRMATKTATKAPVKESRPKVRLTKLFIDNEWADPTDGGEFETYNPATGEAIAKVAAAGPADVDRAVKAARRALESGPWSTMDAADRGKLLFKLADLVEQNAGELAALESLNCGKTIADSTGDMEGVCNTLRYYAGWADKVEGRTIPVRGNFFSYTLRQPVGVVGQIIPWNFPLLMLAWKWGPALACGNTVVMKPAEQTPLTALRLAELAREAGFPAGVINILNGLGETTGAALVAHPDVDKIAFTGHVDTAKIIQKAAAETLKRVTFELGGKSPNVIFADADLDAAVAGAFHAIYFHGGQCCTAGSRLFVESKIKEEFVERLAEKAKGRVVGDPLDPKTEQGPQVSQEQLDKILHYVGLGEKEGARLITGGERVGGNGFFVQPTIFDDVRDDMAIARDEIFGPVVSVLPFQGVDEVIERANKTHYGLAAAIWTKDIDKAHLYAKKVKAGTVWVNCYHVVDSNTPFGGFKMSGQGRENGEAALEHYTELKTVTIKLG